uniref:Uncharacterized protein n=1 Tax=Siphoviridae sp. ctuvi3 TaxID=2825718 RepID=A0A8S5TZM5_9CAUD|nr:MAG TPA: hypothetical protein [Siphoviridae sp. ctuvi3]
MLFLIINQFREEVRVSGRGLSHLCIQFLFVL